MISSLAIGNLTRLPSAAPRTASSGAIPSSSATRRMPTRTGLPATTLPPAPTTATAMWSGTIPAHARPHLDERFVRRRTDLVASRQHRRPRHRDRRPTRRPARMAPSLCRSRSATGGEMLAFISTDGGMTWNATITISSITDHHGRRQICALPRCPRPRLMRQAQSIQSGKTAASAPGAPRTTW